MIVRPELNSSEKVILCSRDIAVTYKLSDIFLEYEVIFDKRYAEKMIGELYAVTASLPYTKVTSIHYHRLLKKTLLGRLKLTTCLNMITMMTLRTKMETFTTLPSRKF